MATLITKFSVGDVVYRAGTTTVRKQHPCPDCSGSRKWKAASPAGDEYEFDCPRCNSRYQSNDALSLDYSEFAPTTKLLTIGQVRVQEGGDPREVQYMCHETGIGSGTLHNERNLFHTRDEAQVAAEGLAAQHNATAPWVAKIYNRTLSLSDYQLSNATKKHAEDVDSTRRVRIGMLFDDLRGAETLEDVKNAMERYSERDAP